MHSLHSFPAQSPRGISACYNEHSMKWLRSIRNSALFVDLLLIVVAIIAIVGLATFVRLHNSNTPKAHGQTNKLTLTNQHLEPLAVADEGVVDGAHTPAPGTTNSNPSQPAPSPELRAASPLPSLPITIPAQAVCDELRKQEILRIYNQDVTKENSAYNTQVNNSRSLIGILDLNSLLDSLLKQHQLTLNTLLASLQKQLATISCTL